MPGLNTKGHIRIGVSGWIYPPWRGEFYPKGLKQREELGFASRTLSSIEINGSFYGLLKPDSYARWHDEVPEDFVFSLKAPKFITHVLRLRDAELPLANFLASGPLRLGPKLGPILWQLPPSFHFDAALIEAFVKSLPQDTEAAAAQAARHDGHVAAPWCKTDGKRRLRHAMEIRHASFVTPEFVDLLRAHDVALVCADTVEWPRLGDVTSDFVYCRLHGDAELYVSGYDASSIAAWGKRVEGWRDGATTSDLHLVTKPAARLARDVFVYFDNTTKTRAPYDAQALMKLVDGVEG